MKPISDAALDHRLSKSEDGVKFNGRVLFLLGLHRPGILSLNIRTPFECPADPPQKIGVLGVSQPSLTG